MSRICDTCARPLNRGEQGTCFECNLVALMHGACPDEEDEPEPEAPCEEDLVTPDHRRFFRFGFEHKGPAVEVADGEDWEPAVRDYMGRTHYFPSVWFVSDHGNFHILNVNGDR